MLVLSLVSCFYEASALPFVPGEILSYTLVLSDLLFILHFARAGFEIQTLESSAVSDLQGIPN